MEHHRCSIYCIIPPYVIDHMAASDDAKVRKAAQDVIASAAEARAVRTLMGTLPKMAAIPSPAAKKHRLVYDLKGKGTSALPGKLVRSEGDPATKDPAVNEAYRYSGRVYDFYKRNYGRNSLDDNGMSLISSVHLYKKHNNAYWNGEQMMYGDGDGLAFTRFTKALDVVGHELTHGVVTHTCNLEYQYESGALNEHFADVMGVLVEQWRKKKTAKAARWLLGEDCMGAATTAKALRSFKNELAFENDLYLGTDPQPKHMNDKYTGSGDYGGVHINSGIPNHAFYLFATSIGGRAWGRAGKIWYQTLYRLNETSNFSDMVTATISVATDRHGAAHKVTKALRKAWKGVGLLP